jgi:hypothetical protein
MINDFKFLTKNKKAFTFEFTGRISWTPIGLMEYERWSHDRSVLIKEWLSDYCYGIHPGGFNKIKYFPEFDRTVEIIQTGLDTHVNQRVFTAKIRIYVMRYHYMDIELMYPI